MRKTTNIDADTIQGKNGERRRKETVGEVRQGSPEQIRKRTTGRKRKGRTHSPPPSRPCLVILPCVCVLMYLCVSPCSITRAYTRTTELPIVVGKLEVDSRYFSDFVDSLLFAFRVLPFIFAVSGF